MTYVQVAYQYARDVVEGRKVAGDLVRRACQRFLDDAARAEKGEFPFIFDEKRAERACAFIEKLPHIKGAWARRGESIKLEPFQIFGTVNIFGWVTPDCRRRFREAYIFLPRKNAKSTWAAGVGLFMLSADGEFAAEVYSGATTEKQAHEVFAPARMMALKQAGFRRHFGIQVNAKSIVKTDDGSKFEPIIGKPGEGASPHCAIIDEFHEHADSTLYDAMVTGMGAREQGLVLIITTAGTALAGPCWEKHNYARDVLLGNKQDDALFALIYCADPEDDWQSLETAKKANPNFGVSVYPDYIEKRLKTAKQSAAAQNAYKTKHLNVWVGARAAWMNATTWQACPKPRPLSELRGRVCYVGFDMATTADLAVRVAIFPPIEPGEPHHVHALFYLPEATVEQGDTPNASQYAAWALQGYITLTDGNIIDQARIIADFKEFAQQHRVLDAGYDPYQAEFFATTLLGEGLPMVKVPQNVGQLSPAMKKIEALVMSKQLAHDNPVLTWNMTNVTARVDDKDNVFPRRATEEAKIDGAVGLFIAANRLIAGKPQHAPGVFII